MAIEICQEANHHRLTFWNTLDTSRLAKAHQLYDRVLEFHPNYIDALQGKGDAYMAESKFDSALAYAEKVIFLDENYQKAYGLKGECFYELKEFDLALENYQKAINLPPKIGDWRWFNLAMARVYICKNELVEAMICVDRTLRVDRHYEQAMAYASKIFFDLGEYERALVYLEKCIRKSNSLGEPWHKFTILLFDGKPDQALEFRKEYCRNTTSKVFCDYSMVLYHHFREDYPKVLSACRNFEMSFFKFHITLYEILALWKLGFRQEAQAKLKNLPIEENLRNLKYRGTYYLIAGAYATVGDKAKAMEIIRDKYNYVFHQQHHIMLNDPFFENLRDDPEFLALVRQAREEKAAFRAEVRAMEERGELNLPF